MCLINKEIFLGRSIIKNTEGGGGQENLKNLSTNNVHFKTHSSDLGSVSEQYMWDLWWTKWQWGRFVSQRFGIFIPVNVPL